MKKIILLGNPNCGKTTLFNVLTKSHRRTGNRIGVTVDTASGVYKCKNIECEIIDLPGVYSLSPFTAEEKIVGDYLSGGDYDAIINIINSENPERSFPLTLSALKLHKPIILAFNFCDTLKKKNIDIDIKTAETLLGAKAAAISAYSEIGLTELMEKAITAEKPSGFIMSDTDTYKFSEKLSSKIFIKDKEKHTEKRLDFDKFVLNKYAAYPLLALFTAFIFIATFSGLSGRISDSLDTLFTVKLYETAENFLTSVGSNRLFISLICDGIIGGIGSVLSFLPQITVLTVLMAIFEDTGYLSRTAYICDKPFRKFGLQGKCFFCVMMGFGCSVPAIMSTRVLESRRDRIRTIMLIPFMPCNAKLPLFVMMSSLFFRSSPLIIIFLYAFGAAVGFTYMFILNRRKRETENSLFFLEMPPYRMPSIKSIKYSVITRVGEFLFKAGTVLIISSVVLWFFSSFTSSFVYTADSSKSMLGTLGKITLPVFTPLGITEWKQSVSIISGLIARESIVSSLEILYNNDSLQIANAFSKASALSVCTFSLLFLPCMATLTAIRKELKSVRLFITAVLTQSFIAYIISIIVYNIGRCVFGG